MLRQAVGDLVPGRLVRDEDVLPGAHAGIVVERAQRQAVPLLVEVESAEQFRAADTAEAALGSRRSFIPGHQLLALLPTEIAHAYAGASAKRRPVRLAAHRAMAVQRAGESAGDLVAHAAAEATAAEHYFSSTSTKTNSCGFGLTTLCSTPSGRAYDCPCASSVTISPFAVSCISLPAVSTTTT